MVFLPVFFFVQCTEGIPNDANCLLTQYCRRNVACGCRASTMEIVEDTSNNKRRKSPKVGTMSQLSVGINI